MADENLSLVDEDYITRMTGFEIDCNDGKGDPMACHQVGEFLSLVRDDRVRAGKVFEKNCTDQKYSASCFNLAKLYMTGKGVEQSDEKAEDYFKQSCTGGHLYGCYHQVEHTFKY
jgi:TPR repeat protein